MASLQALSAASQDRKARLAQLKSLKRKQPDTPTADDDENTIPTDNTTTNSHSHDTDDVPAASTTDKYLSGRNYDPTTKGPRLGFEHAPSANTTTLESQAAALAAETAAQAAADAQEDKPLGLFKLQPKKPNWDLKRDLERKLDVLGVRTDNAIARLVRERIAGQRKVAVGAGNGGGGEESGNGEALGIAGTTLVEATHVREREDEEEARREREEEEALLDGS